ncbi:MAG: DNA repair protein RecN [Desulfobacterales bacterium]|nr:DNA repair protein RecN [Desulfobacterales bacterium]
MLEELSIKNFAIIDDIKISFSDGLTILTGETGAGKSIIINAVNLLLGSRATSKMIRTGAENAELEAVFSINKKNKVAQIMKELGYDAEEGLIIRRIISTNERHRIYINGRSATMQILNQITENLASIASQHANQSLLKEEQHLIILDQFGGLIPLRDEVSKCYNEIVPLIRRLKNLKELQKNQSEQLARIDFQKKEIEEACIKENEDELLEQEKIKLKHSEFLYQTVNNSIYGLYSSKGAIIETLGEIKKNIDKASQFDSSLVPHLKSIEEASIILEDATHELRAYLGTIETNGFKLEEVESRLNLLNKLKRKYGGSIESVIAHFNSFLKEYSEIENIAEKIIDTEKELKEKHQKLSALAEELSKKRKAVSKDIAKKVEDELKSLKMANTRFFVSIEPYQENNDTYLSHKGMVITESGMDRSVFMIAPNVGEALKPLASIASGGELSRIVLALKVILAKIDLVETVVFDEVDAGIGGDVGEFIGRKIASLSDYHQVICITHLPQIAKFGANHYKIEKHIKDERTITTISSLKNDERVVELARMLGGVELTKTTLKHAKEMIKMVEKENNNANI